MTLFPTSAPGGKFSTQLDADSDFIIETVARARAQGRAEGMEEAAKIADAEGWGELWERDVSESSGRARDVAEIIAAEIRQAAKKGP